jgi:hypothetical protein
MKSKRILVIIIGLISWFMAAAAPPHPQALAMPAVIGTQAQPGQSSSKKSAISIIPLPEKVTLRRGVFDTAEKPEIIFHDEDQEVAALAAYLA